MEDVELGDQSVKESLAVHMAEEHLSVTKVGGWVGCEPVLCWLRNTGSTGGVCYRPFSVTGAAWSKRSSMAVKYPVINKEF